METRAKAEQGTLRREAEALAASVAGSENELDQSLWSKFAQAPTVEAFCTNWLALQCRMIGNVQAGMVLLGQADRGPFRPVAVWPDKHRSLKHLTKTAERTLQERRGLVSRGATDDEPDGATNGHYEIGYPIEARGSLHGAAVLEVASQNDIRLQAVMRQLHWGAAWLELLFSREAIASEQETRERMQAALDLTATVLGHERGYAAAMAFASALAARLACDRVSIGFLRHGRSRVYAMSHSAEFKLQTNLVRAMGGVMDEAIDQRETVVYPPAEDTPPVVVRAHGEFAADQDSGALCTIPLESCGTPIGALLLERPASRPFDRKTIELCQSVAALAGPILDVQRREDRWLAVKAADSVRNYAAKLVGPRHVGLKLGTMAVAGVAAFCFLAEGDYRVSAKSVLEPIVQRAAAAPFDGYIKEAPVRAGDFVQAGQVLCALDDRELKLERLKALSRLEEYQKEFHKAMAEREAAKVEILTAQMNQVQAEIALLDDKLAHTLVNAPFDGIVATGDLSQSLGAPVEKGKVLYEIAPLENYRVVLEVDERDIGDVKVGQRGAVMLSAFPSETLVATVDKVTPVSTAREGRNFFRVEARLDEPHDRLRPGMEGAGKIEIDRRLYVWIWTHQIVDWIRLTLWSWLP